MTAEQFPFLSSRSLARSPVGVPEKHDNNPRHDTQHRPTDGEVRKTTNPSLPPRSSQPFRRSEVFIFPIRLLLFRPLPWCDIPITGRSGIGPPQSRGNGAPGRFGVSDENCFQIFLSPATLCHGVVWMAVERVELHNYLIIFGPGLWLLFSVSINTPPVIIRAHANTQM